jgi:hypothetical protein
MFNLTFAKKSIELNLNETLLVLSGYKNTYNMSEKINISISTPILAQNVSF